MAIAPSVSTYLEKLGVAYTLTRHPKSHCSAETANTAHVAKDHIAKAVLVRHGQQYLLVVIPADQWVNLDRVSREMGQTFALADENEVDRLFVDCRPGAIPPVGAPYGLETLWDNDLMSLANIHFEAGDHERLVTVDNPQLTLLTKGFRKGNFGHC